MQYIFKQFSGGNISDPVLVKGKGEGKVCVCSPKMYCNSHNKVFFPEITPRSPVLEGKKFDFVLRESPKILIYTAMQNSSMFQRELIYPGPSFGGGKEVESLFCFLPTPTAIDEESHISEVRNTPGPPL